jgi:RNA polymerase sigma factor (sigma-70 family)
MRVSTANCEEVLLPHLDAAYNLARWLTRDERDAEDIVQEAYLRAIRHFETFRGDNARPWLLTIVRNTYYTSIQHKRLTEAIDPFDDEEDIFISDAPNPEMLLLQESDKQIVRRALQKLPRQFLEVIILREFEELSYQQIADLVQIPIGTVMSRLARARKRLAQLVSNCCRDTKTNFVVECVS